MVNRWVFKFETPLNILKFRYKISIKLRKLEDTSEKIPGSKIM